MTTEELIEKARAQQPISVTRARSVLGPAFRRELTAGRILRLADGTAYTDRRLESTPQRFGHLLGPPLPPLEIASWQEAWPQHPLPADLSALLGAADGVHLWADLDVGRGYTGLLPLREWTDAAVEWSPYWAFPAAPPVGWLSVGYHDNGDYALMLDTKASVYRWYDLEDFDQPRVVARSVEELLDWLWSWTADDDPRVSAG